jgi:hypothetical protein
MSEMPPAWRAPRQHPRDIVGAAIWIPAFAGMTSNSLLRESE